MMKHYLILMWCSLFVSFPSFAMQLAGVSAPASIEMEGHAEPLVLNGAGIRKKFFISVYVGALYLPHPLRSAEAILREHPANRVTMHFVYREVAKRKLDEAWLEGFKKNLSPQQFDALSSRLARFTAMFRDMREGDQVWLDFLPGSGTRISINGEALGTIPGAEFNSALLSIWLGGFPVTESLKKGMVGVDKP